MDTREEQPQPTRPLYLADFGHEVRAHFALGTKSEEIEPLATSVRAGLAAQQLDSLGLHVSTGVGHDTESILIVANPSFKQLSNETLALIAGLLEPTYKVTATAQARVIRDGHVNLGTVATLELTIPQYMPGAAPDLDALRDDCLVQHVELEERDKSFAPFLHLSLAKYLSLPRAGLHEVRSTICAAAGIAGVYVPGWASIAISNRDAACDVVPKYRNDPHSIFSPDVPPAARPQ